jgi:hypothetical protein
MQTSSLAIGMHSLGAMWISHATNRHGNSYLNGALKFRRVVYL